MMHKKYIPLFLLFVCIMLFVFIFKLLLLSMGFDIAFLYIANIVLFVLSFSGFFLQVKGLQSTNSHAFVRGVYSSLILKIFIVMIAILAYVFLTHGKVNKPSLFTSMGLYIVYTCVEVAQLMKIARQKNNA